jgi:hypothetical protein
VSSSAEETLRQRRGDEERCSSVDRQDRIPWCCLSRIAAAIPSFQSNKPCGRTGVKGEAFADAGRRGQLSVHAATVYCPSTDRLFTRACWSVTRLTALHAQPLQTLHRFPLYPRNSTGYPMSSCRLSITSNGSITDGGWGTPLSRASAPLAGLWPAGLLRRCAPAACRWRGVRPA